MNREFHRWWSNDLQRNMDMLVFGHDGPKVLVFPTSMGRYFEYEDNKMVAALADRLEPASCNFTASTASTPKAGTTSRHILIGGCSATCNTKTTS